VADAGAPAYLALAPSAVMLADRRSMKLLAVTLATVVVADAGAPAYLALAPSVVMLADRQSMKLLAVAAAVMIAYRSYAILLARALDAIVLTNA
jgi:hypothetical protein